MPPAGSTTQTPSTSIAPKMSMEAPPPAPPNAWPTYPMDPIPEEELDSAVASPSRPVPDGHSRATSSTKPTSPSRSVERVSRKREVYTSEQVDTLVSTLPEDIVPDEWKNYQTDEIVNDPISRTTYIYESHMDEPSDGDGNQFADTPEENLETHSTQKVTRVTKVTTTRSVKQVPVDPADIYFDGDGNPLSNEYEGVVADGNQQVGINLSKASLTETTEEAITDQASRCPQAPARPEVLVTTENDLLLSWQPPKVQGSGGPVIGYLVEFQRGQNEPWEAAHDELLVDTDCRVSKLEDLDYRFRVTAANPAGFGPPSLCSLPPARLAHTNPTENVASYQESEAPARPRIVSADRDRVIIEWDRVRTSKELVGYKVEFKEYTSPRWILAHDEPLKSAKFEFRVPQPNGAYEFRVSHQFVDGTASVPSQSSGLVGAAPMNGVDELTPGPPAVLESGGSWARLGWSAADAGRPTPCGYLIEVMDSATSMWMPVGEEEINGTEFIADNLQPEVSYRFRVRAVLPDGRRSAPSQPSEVVRLGHTSPHYAELEAPRSKAYLQSPERPSPPEYLDFDGGNSVTLCWLPAKSTLPVLGYDVEFRDIMQDSAWYKVTDSLVRSCKTAVGYLIHGHQYQFRVLAKNANGFSEPSDPSPLITIGSLTKDTKYLEAERYGAVSLLQDEMIRESPPLPDRDDSPPPMYRQPNQSNLQWRDPTLKEVIDYLKSQDEDVVKDASGYLQHLTYHNDLIKEDTRQYGGIPLLVKLLQHPHSEIVRNCCGSLKNLSYGKNNDVNKKVINADGGIKALGQVLKTTSSVHVREEATGALWNISSCDDLKEAVFHQVADLVVSCVVVPCSGVVQNQAPEQGKHGTAAVFRNGTGVLRNISAASPDVRKLLRVIPGLIEALLFALKSALERHQVDTQSVENTICILRNLSYRVQEVVDPKYNPRAASRSGRERSKSAPHMSPKSKKKGLFKKKKEDSTQAGSVSGPPLLWHPSTVDLYLRLLQDSARPEILEASAAALQNLAACNFEGSVQVRQTVRTSKGLPVLVELLKLHDDKVVSAVMTALRNLCIDPKNLELVCRHAMRDLLSKLPAPSQEVRNPDVSDATIGAVLGILWEVARSSTELTKAIHDNGGTDRLRTLAKSYPTHGKRVCKYATQVLFLMWQHRELQDGFRRAGLKDADFYCDTLHRKSRSAAPSDVATLRRPFSSQGDERPAHLRSETADDTIDSQRFSNYDAFSPKSGRASSAKYADLNVTPSADRSMSARPDLGYVKQEPLYAAVHKQQQSGRRGSIGGDSWV